MLDGRDTPPSGYSWRQEWFVLVFLFVIAELLVLWAWAQYFHTAWTYEFSSYGDIARSLSRGSYSTHFILPAELARLEAMGRGDPPWPVAQRFPLFPLWIAAFFRMFGAGDGVLVMASAILWGLFVVATYRAARALFPAGRARAGLAAGITLATPVFWAFFAMWGYACFLFALLLLAHHVFLVRAIASGARARRFLPLGLLGGVAYLSRFNFVLFVPVSLLLIATQSGNVRRGRSSLAYCAGFCIIFLPFFYWQHASVGPLQSLTFSGNLANLRTDHLSWLDYGLSPSAWQVLVQHGGAILGKWLRNVLEQVLWLLRQFGYNLLVPFAAFGGYRILTAPARPAVRLFVQVYAACALVQITVFSLLRAEPLGRYWVWLAPCTTLLAAHGILRLREELVRVPVVKRYGAAATGALLALFLFTQVRFRVPPPDVGAWTQQPPQELEWRQIARIIPPDALTVSNVGVHMAWYTGRSAIDLPNTVEQLEAMIRNHRIGFLFVADWPNGELNHRPAWMQVVRDPGWPGTLARRLAATRVVETRRGYLFVLPAR